MEFVKRAIRHAVSTAVVLALVAAGCGDGGDSTAREEIGTGTIAIDPSPEAIAGAGWIEESSQNHVYFHLEKSAQRSPLGDSFVWERNGDTLHIYYYERKDGAVGREYLRLIRQ